MVTVALEGENTKPGEGTACPPPQGDSVGMSRPRGVVGLWGCGVHGVMGCIGSGLSLGGKGWRRCSDSVANGGTWQLRGVLGPG